MDKVNIGSTSASCPITFKNFPLTLIAEHKSLGCWKDTIPRVIEELEGKSVFLNGPYTKRSDPIDKCADAAADKGFTVFAVQDGGECFASADAKTKYNTKGQSSHCSSGTGGPMANDVYELSKLSGF